MSYLKLVEPAGTAVSGWYTALWAVGLSGAWFKLNKVLTVTLFFVLALLVLLSLGTFTGSDFLIMAGAFCGVVSAAIALYPGLAQIWNAAYGRTVLPVFPWGQAPAGPVPKEVMG